MTAANRSSAAIEHNEIVTPRRREEPTLEWAWRIGGFGLVVLLGVAAFVGFWITRRDEDASADRRRQDVVDAAASMVESELIGVSGALVGAGVVVGTDGLIDLDAFEVFATEALDESNATAIAAEQRVADVGRAAFEDRTGRPITDAAEAGFVEASRRDTYCPIVDVAPLNEATRTLLGFDVCGDGQRRLTRDEAARTFGVVLSPVISGQPDGRRTVFMVRSLRQPGTTDAADVVGFITAGFVVDDLVAAAVVDLPDGVEPRVLAADVHAYGPPENAGFDTSTRIDLFGQTWTLQIRGDIPADHSDSWAVMLGGLGLTALVGAVLHRRSRYERAITAMATMERSRAERSATLALLAKGLSSASGRDEVRRAVTEGVSAVVRAHFVALGVIEDGGLEVGVGSGLVAEMRAKYRRIDLDAHNPMSEAVRSGEPVLLATQAEYCDRFPELADDVVGSGTQSSTVHPLRDGRGRLIGSLGVAWREPIDLGAELLTVMSTVAEMVAQTLERSELTDLAAVDARRDARRGAIITDLAGAASVAEVVAIARRTLAAGLGVSGAAITIENRQDRSLQKLAVVGQPEPAEDGHHVLAARAAVSTGFLSIRAWTVDPSSFGGDELDDMADAVAAAIDRAHARSVEHAVVTQLQQSLLTLDVPETIAVAGARYRAADQPLRVGGDWYDVVALADARVAVVVGDVVGHGVSTVVAMAQLRSALSASASEARDPAAALEALDRFAERTPETMGASVAYGVVDASRSTVDYCVAGHPPPLVIGPDGTARLLRDGRRPLLGVRSGDGGSALGSGPFPPGSTLVLYTDGLIERRDESIDAGLNRLLRAAEASGALPTGALCDHLIEELATIHDGLDDVAVVAVRTEVSNCRLHVQVLDGSADADGARGRLRSWIAAAVTAPNLAGAVIDTIDSIWNERLRAVDRAGREAIVRIEAGVVGRNIVVALSDSGPRRGATPAADGEVEWHERAGEPPCSISVRQDDRGTTVRLEFLGVADELPTD